MKKRNLLVFALCAAAALGAVAVNTNEAEAKTITCAQDASQVTYGTLTDSQKEMIAKYFNAEYYASQYFDVVQAVGNDREALLKHFCDCGIWEGRHGWAEFDVSAYASAYNLKEKYGKDIAAYYEDYFTVGLAEGRYLTTVELCEANGIKVESLFGEYKFLDTSIYKAANLMGTTDYNAVAQAVAVATETHQPVVVQVPNPNGGEPEEFVVADPTNPIMDKCKNLTLVGEFNRGSGVTYILCQTTTGFALSNDEYIYDSVIYSTDGNDEVKFDSEISYFYIGESNVIRRYMDRSERNANPDGRMEEGCQELLDSNKQYEGVIGVSRYEDFNNDGNYYSQPNFYKGSLESVTPSADVEGLSGHAYFAEVPENADESLKYNVGVDIKQTGDNYVDVTVGVYNEDRNFAQLVEYNNIIINELAIDDEDD